MKTFETTVNYVMAPSTFYTKSNSHKIEPYIVSPLKTIVGHIFTFTQCLKIIEKVAFNIASEASYVYILSGQKSIKNENLKLAVK